MWACYSLGIMHLRKDEIELELGLSIGGSFGKAKKLKSIKKESKPNNNLVRGSMVVDTQTKHKIQALRRQEVKKKREEKQQKRGIIISLRCHQDVEFISKDNDVHATPSPLADHFSPHTMTPLAGRHHQLLLHTFVC